MLLVNIEGILLDNIVIYQNELYFSDMDSSGNVFYSKVPANLYVKDTDYYLKVESILYDVLEFDNEDNIKAFKELCLMESDKGNYNFTFEDLAVDLEEIEDYELDIV